MRPRFCLCVGTRPELIKMAPVARELAARSADAVLLHTGQHPDPPMDARVRDDLGLPEPDVRLSVAGAAYGTRLGAMMRGARAAFARTGTDVVVVQGDTLSVLACALAASRDGRPVAHVEAGLRCHDPTLAEETNRVLVDHGADLLFAPTPGARDNALAEGIDPERIRVVGNTVADALREALPRARERSRIVRALGLVPGGYAVATLHRAATVDRRRALGRALDGLDRVATSGLPVVLPVHPRTVRRAREHGLSGRLLARRGLRVVAPLGYLDFLALAADARLVLTDSGGVQEEACILGVPCVTLRDSTERPETVAIGANRLSSLEPEAVADAARAALRAPRGWRHPYGPGDAARRVVDGLLEGAQRRRPKCAS